MTELKELKEHVRWLEDERATLGAVEERIDEIEERLREIKEDLTDLWSATIKNSDELARLVSAFNGIADAVNRNADATNKNADVLKELISVFTPKRPAPVSPNANKPKPRKPKLSVVQKDDGPGAAR